MWEQMGYLCTAALLAYHSIFDIKRQRIPGRSLAVGVVASFGWAMVKGMLEIQPWAALGAGLLPGTAALVLAGVTREQVGRGDGWELILMGNTMGVAYCLQALGVALLGIFVISVILLLLGKARKSTRIAFVPFLWTGTMVVLFWQWIWG